MGRIALEGLEFFAYHGYSDEEQRIGNRYSVDLIIATDFHFASTDDTLEDTIDYVQLANIVQEEMLKPSRLLEHLGHRITNRLFSDFYNITHITLRISKFNPPIGYLCNRAYIEIEVGRSS